MLVKLNDITLCLEAITKLHLKKQKTNKQQLLFLVHLPNAFLYTNFSFIVTLQLHVS